MIKNDYFCFIVIVHVFVLLFSTDLISVIVITVHRTKTSKLIILMFIIYIPAVIKDNMYICIGNLHVFRECVPRNYIRSLLLQKNM